jgi:hypothetical protein
MNKAKEIKTKKTINRRRSLKKNRFGTNGVDKKLIFKYVTRDTPDSRIVYQYIQQEYEIAKNIVDKLYEKYYAEDEDMGEDDDMGEDELSYDDKMQLLFTTTEGYDEETVKLISTWGAYGEAMEGFKNCFEESNGVALFYINTFNKDNIIIMFNVFHNNSTLEYKNLNNKNGELLEFTDDFHEDDFFNGKNIYTQIHIGIHKPFKYNSKKIIKDLAKKIDIQVTDDLETEYLYYGLAMDLHMCALCYVHHNSYPQLNGFFLFGPTNKMKYLAIDYFNKKNSIVYKIDSKNSGFYDNDYFSITGKIQSNNDCVNAKIGVYMNKYKFFNDCKTYNNIYV